VTEGGRDDGVRRTGERCDKEISVNTALWIAQGLLAAAFATSGAMKLARSREQLQGRSPWMEDFSDSTLKFIGVCEVLGAIGLVLPPLLDIAPWLAPIAATGLTTMMALAALMHVRRNEPAGIVVTLVLGAIAVFIACGRFGPEPF
jgi:uncharacterized membrane protein YphA (DoxX/SURF4 family)